MFIRLLSYLKPYAAKLSITVVAIIVYAIFSSLSIWMVGPLFNLIFYPQNMTEQVVTNPISSLPLESESNFAFDLKSKINSYVNSYIITDTRLGTLYRICIGILIVFFIKNMAYYLNLYMTSLIEQSVVRDIRNELFESIANLSLDYFNKSRVGTLISRLTNDVEIVNVAIAATFLNLIKDPLLLFIYLFIALVISWKLTIISLLVSLSMVFILYRIGKILRKQSIRSQEKMAGLISAIQETISGMRVVKAFATEEFETDKFKKESTDYHGTMSKVMVFRKLSSPISEMLGILAITIVLWYGGKQVIVDGSILPNEFIVYLFALFSMMQPLKAIGGHYTRIQEGLAAGERIFDVIDTVPMIINKDNAIIAEGLRESIEFKDVSFDYGEGEILKNINLTIKSGDVIALVGPSGAGKSTLASLIPRFYDPSEGEILFDGKNLNEFDLKSLRKLTGYVTQEVILFNNTIRNNIAYGRPDVEDKEIIKSAKMANAHDFIKEFPKGYDTEIGDRGTRLSGGQQQRISIARAILNNPPILIFDEATSSLDADSEKKVQEAIERLMKNRTVIVIAHRLSTIKNADKIIVLDNGVIVQSGTHEELLKKDGLFSKLYNIQYN